MSTPLLEINGLTVAIAGAKNGEDERRVLDGLNLTVHPGEIHAIMGPNGSGKSTLANVIAGRDGYKIISGNIRYKGEDLLDLAADERARVGIFLGFQYPVEIPGVNNVYFLRAALNAQRRARGENELDAGQFLKLMRAKLKEFAIKEDLLQRAVNVGFSGGEKKRNEIFQMSVLEPKLAILDEIDSGLDIDALKAIAAGLNRLRDPSRAMLIITHYRRLLDYIEPDFIHVLADGRIVRSGTKELAGELEREGYVGQGDIESGQDAA